MKSFFSKSLFFFTFFVFFLLISAFNACPVSADVLFLRNGSEIKGLVVDEYVDRVVISTFEGEKIFLRSDIESIEYEDTETRLLELGKDAFTRGKYKTAMYYYRAVLKLNPGSAQAHDGEMTAIRKELSSGAEIAKEEIALMDALDDPDFSPDKKEIISYEENVRDLLGLKIKRDEGTAEYYVYDVLPDSPSAYYGILKKDIISAVWNENMRYVSYEDVIRKLSGPEFSMVKLSIERRVLFYDPKNINLSVGLKEEGYFIKELSGMKPAASGLLKPGDWFVEVNSVSTRYLPKDELYGLLSDDMAPFNLLIKRDLYITREKGE